MSGEAVTVNGSAEKLSADVEPAATKLADSRLELAIRQLIEAARDGGDPSAEVNALTELVGQLQQANEHLVISAVRAQVLQEEAELRNKRQNEFLAMLAHELRNPMAPISSAAQLLQRIVTAHPMLGTVQEILARQVNHMSRLLDDLLDASRITTGKVNLQIAELNLADVLSQAIEVSRPHFERRRQRFEVTRDGEVITIMGDMVRLTQVFSNLLINASKYTHEGGWISLTVRAGDKNVHVDIADNGRGIEPEFLPYLFDLFTQGERNLDRSEGGLGVGLSVAQGIAQMHGGAIIARSEGTGRGSCFTISLPRWQSETVRHIHPVMEASVAPKKLSILLVEDNADFSTMFKSLLELDGHTVEVSDNGLEGLARMAACHFDVLICDLGLPGLTGYELIRQLRHRPECGHVLAIALSGYCQAEDRSSALEAGFDFYFTKPVQMATIKQLLSSRQARDFLPADRMN